jgi:hypothetical protein
MGDLLQSEHKSERLRRGDNERHEPRAGRGSDETSRRRARSKFTERYAAHQQCVKRSESGNLGRGRHAKPEASKNDHQKSERNNCTAPQLPERGRGESSLVRQLCAAAKQDDGVDQRKSHESGRQQPRHEQAADRKIGDEAEYNQVNARRDGLGHDRGSRQQRHRAARILTRPPRRWDQHRADGRDIGHLRTGNAEKITIDNTITTFSPPRTRPTRRSSSAIKRTDMPFASIR